MAMCQDMLRIVLVIMLFGVEPGLHRHIRYSKVRTLQLTTKVILHPEPKMVRQCTVQSRRLKMEGFQLSTTKTVTRSTTHLMAKKNRAKTLK